MLRITTNKEKDSSAITLEGRLTCDGVPCLVEAWSAAAATGKNVVLDLTGISAVDGQGRQLLVQMHARGVQLTGSGLAVRGLIEEITE